MFPNQPPCSSHSLLDISFAFVRVPFTALTLTGTHYLPDPFLHLHFTPLDVPSTLVKTELQYGPPSFFRGLVLGLPLDTTIHGCS